MRVLAYIIGSLALLAAGCGAPVKSAGEVSHIFSGDGTSLSDKMKSLCTQLSQRSSPPNLSSGGITVGSCANPGLAAVDLSSAQDFAFLGLDDGKEEDGVVKIDVRAQVWLNKGLLGLASKLAQKMKESEGMAAGAISFDDEAAAQIKKVMKIKSEFIEPPKFDLQAMTLNFLLSIEADGIVRLNNKIRADGALIDNMFAVTGSTIKDVDDRTVSDLKRIRLALLVVPHASDVYVDLFIEVALHSYGAIFDAVIKDKVQPMLTSGLKDMLTALMGLEK